MESMPSVAVAVVYFDTQRHERAQHNLDTVRETDGVRQEVGKTDTAFMMHC